MYSLRDKIHGLIPPDTCMYQIVLSKEILKGRQTVTTSEGLAMSERL
jgi:hypothetical protein